MTIANLHNFRNLILQAEIAALLHDIGKFALPFLSGNTNGGKNLGNHTTDFIDPSKDMITPSLYSTLTASLPEGWLKVPDGNSQLQTLGDLLARHHPKSKEELNTAFKPVGNQAYPMLFYLMMYGDVIDSSSSKGGANFPKRKGRRPILSEKEIRQDFQNVYLSTPFGEMEQRIIDGGDPAEFAASTKHFQENLGRLIADYPTWRTASEITVKRLELLSFLEKNLAQGLAETRQPTNDVTLWQHSYSAASIFKAMLARHVILGDYKVEEGGELAHYREKLAYVGVKWSEDRVLERSVRPKDILGRVHGLSLLSDRIREIVEIGYCVGNEAYRDRNGIYFLVPDPGENEASRETFEAIFDSIQGFMDDNEFFSGDFNYQILCKPVGIQVLGLAELIGTVEGTQGPPEPLRTGPIKPGWMGLWKEAPKKCEICTVCGLRPVELVGSSTGSEMDVQKRCGFCQELERNTAAQRKEIIRKAASLSSDSDFFTFETEDLISEDSENSRLALVQGIFDLEGFLSGEAFSGILARRPADYTNDPGKDDQCRGMDLSTWKDFLSAVRSHWEKIQKGAHDDRTKHLFQQIFHDTYLGEEDDGRVGGDKNDKLRNYIEQIVFASPFPRGLHDWQKIALYALRQHPAPSRIMRAWETTRKVCQYTVKWCEKNKVRYAPLSIDPGRFLLLVPAQNAWDFLQGLYREYERVCGRVRHLLPIHVAACVFYKKFPLYIGIDAMRRFSEVGLSDRQAFWWTLKKKEKTDTHCILQWTDHNQRNIRWKMPALTPNGKEERFFTWFWVEGKDRPVCLGELEIGARARIRPSTFDYEVLDATTRRYDIRISGDTSARPHLFAGDLGPRPYPLEEIERWESEPDIQALKDADQHRISRLVGFLGDMHRRWDRREHADIFERQAGDYLEISLGKSSDLLRKMAVSGELFDIIEWDHFIGK